jgi:hypothetical protein
LSFGVGEGEGDDGGLAFGFDGSLVSRSDERRDVVGSGLGDGAGSVLVVGDGLADGSGVVSLIPTLGAAPPAAGTRGRAAATGDEPACSVFVNVITVAAATVVMTVAAANLYTLVGCMRNSPGADGGDDNAIHRSGDGRRGHIRPRR